MSGTLRAWSCWPSWGLPSEASTHYAETAGKARYECLTGLVEFWPDTAFTDIRARSLGPAEGLRDDDLDRIAASYGLPPIPLGTPAKYGNRPCTVAGHSGGYVAFLDDETGQRFFDHILCRKTYFLADGTVIDGEARAREIDAYWESANSCRAV